MSRQTAASFRPDDEEVGSRDLFLDSQTSNQELSRSVRALWSAVYRSRLLIAGIMAVFIFIGLGVTMLMTPQYKATASVQIDQQSSNVLGSSDQSAVDPGAAWQDADRFLQTEQDVLQSRAMAITVMEDLNLNADDQFLHHMGVDPADKPAGVLSMVDTKQEQIVKILMDELTVEVPRNSRVASISFMSPDSHLAARVANAFAADFMLFNMKRKFGSSTYARNFLDTQLADTRTKLEASERALLNYARGAKLLDVSGGIAAGTEASTASSTPRSLTTSNLVEINDAYAQAQAARVQAEQHWAQAQTTPPLELQEVLTNPAVMQLSQLKAQAQAAYQQDLQRHKPDFPQMQQAAAHIAELDRQIATLAGSIRSSIREQYQVTVKQESALGGKVSNLMSSTQNEQSRSVEYNILKRALDTNRTMYDSLLQRYAEVSAEAGVAANNISQVDVAYPSLKPVRPRPVINMAIAGILGVICAAAVVLLRDKFDDSVRTPEDVNTKLGITFLNATPLLEDVSPQEALDDPRSALSEAYVALRTSIELGHKGGAPKVLTVTSTRQSEGKSTTAYAIARNFARIGRRVVLIDGDLRKPSLHRLANVENKVGLSNLLAHLAGADEALQLTSIDGLALISAGPLPPNPAELLSGPRLSEIISSLSSRFDMIVIDAPPVLGLADTILLGSAADATLFVIEANGSHHGHAKTAVRRLASSGITILGALLSKYDARKTGYGYGYGYNYSYSYSYGDEGTEPTRRWNPFKR